MTTREAATPQELARRLEHLSSKLKAAKQPEYTPSSKESCLAACRNFVRLTWGLEHFNTVRGSSGDGPYTRDFWSAISSAFQDGAVEYDYKICLADCIDDQAKQYSQKVSDCVIKATSQDELDRCRRIADEYEKFGKLEKEVKRLEQKLSAV
ncbi:hypothetical protein RI367_006162 [Sorochytrium milnesiophthora]